MNPQSNVSLIDVGGNGEVHHQLVAALCFKMFIQVVYESQRGIFQAAPVLAICELVWIRE